MFNYYLPFLISIIISSSLAPLLFSLSYVVIILPIAVVGLIEYFLSVSPVLYLDSSIAYLIIFSSCDIVFVVETGILGAGNPAAIALLNVDILSLSVYPPVSTTAPAAVPVPLPPPAGVASPVTGVAVGTPVAGAVVAAEATALDGTLVPLGPPVGGLGDDRSDLALDNKPEAADAIPDTIPPAVEPVGVEPVPLLPEPAGGIAILNPEPAGGAAAGADEGGATGAGAEPEGAEGGATGAGAEPEGGATGAGAEPEGGATGAGADEGGAEGGGAEPEGAEGGATGAGAEPEGGATGAGATGAGAEGGVVIVIEEGTIGAAGVGVIVAVSVSYFTFLLLSNSPDSNFANSLNFISFNDLPPITSSNKS